MNVCVCGHPEKRSGDPTLHRLRLHDDPSISHADELDELDETDELAEVPPMVKEHAG